MLIGFVSLSTLKFNWSLHTSIVTDNKCPIWWFYISNFNSHFQVRSNYSLLPFIFPFKNLQASFHHPFLQFWKPQKVIYTRVRSNIWFDSTIFGNFNKFTQIHCLRTAAEFFGKVFYGRERKCVTWQWVWADGFEQYCLVQCEWLPKPKPDLGAKGTSVFSKW